MPSLRSKLVTDCKIVLSSLIRRKPEAQMQVYSVQPVTLSDQVVYLLV